MEWTGFHKTCANKSGGVRSISLARASALKTVTFDTASSSYSAITLDPAGPFVPFHFREDSASFVEEASWEAGAMLVRHRLSFSVDPMDAASGGGGGADRRGIALRRDRGDRGDDGRG